MATNQIGNIPRELINMTIGPGYGLPSEGMIEAVQMLACTEGILIDPVYTGNGMAGMISMVRAGRFMHDEDVIFIHTGGSAALFGYRWAFGQSEP